MKRWILLFIIIGAFVVRIWGVTKNPPALSWDEVSIGYNAYSIWKTGHDEHGRFLPLDVFTAYGDYKPPLAIYLTVPFVAIFGLSELAVRLPSVLAGTGAVILTYFLVRELGAWLGKKSDLSREELALVAAATMAVTPWSIMLSRGGFEANIGSFFIILGMLMLLVARREARYLIWASIPFSLAMYTFNSSRYIAPVFMIGGVFLLGLNVRKNIKQLTGGGLVFMVMLLPLLPHLISSEARLRYMEVNIFTDAEIVNEANARIAQDGNAWWAKVIHNRRWGYARSYLQHYLDHFEPGFLFIRGDGNPKFSTQETGQLYLWEAPFLFFGLLALFVYEKRVAAFLLFWLIVAIIPAGVARETPHALRTVNTMPVWQIMVAYGVWRFWNWLPNKMWRMGSGMIVGSLWVTGIIYFLTFLYRYYSFEYAGEWQYGYKQALEIITPIEKNYHEIVISDVIGRPYMYTAFYRVWEPRDFIAEKSSYFDAAGFYHVDRLGKFKFVSENGVSEFQSGVLYVLPPKEVPQQARVYKKIYLPNGEEKLVLFDVGI